MGAGTIPRVGCNCEALDALKKKIGDHLDGVELETILEKGAANVSPADRVKLRGLLAHYAKKKHPFRACVRDNTKRFGKERAERICATLKDVIHGNPYWRNKPGPGR